MKRHLFFVVVWAIVSWMVGQWLGGLSGWVLFSLGLLAVVLLNSMQLGRLARWVRHLDEPPPAALGPWDDILAPVYRRLRHDAKELSSLRRNVEGLLLAAEALPDGALTLNAAMELTWCNQTASEHMGLNLQADRYHSIFNVFRVPEFARYARQGHWPAPVLIRNDRSGRPRALLVHMTRFGLDQYLVVSRDVTQIEKLETMRKDFVANVSHELRTPLTVLSGFLETLHDSPPEALDAAKRRHYLGLMREQAHRMQATVGDLLTLSALESTPHANGKPIVMADLIATALSQAQALSNQQHNFHTDIDQELALVGVPGELSSALSNLLANAVHYTPADGHINLYWQKQEDGSACFSVHDTGIGIAQRDIARLTERFYRADQGRSRVKGGTGLGLAITRHVALRHDAELHIESKLGEGSRFSLCFPASRVVDARANMSRDSQ